MVYFSTTSDLLEGATEPLPPSNVHCILSPSSTVYTAGYNLDPVQCFSNIKSVKKMKEKVIIIIFAFHVFTFPLLVCLVFITGSRF